MVGHHGPVARRHQSIDDVGVAATVFAEAVRDDDHRPRLIDRVDDVIGDRLAMAADKTVFHALHIHSRFQLRMPSLDATPRPTDSIAPSGRSAASPIPTSASTLVTTCSSRATMSPIDATVLST